MKIAVKIFAALSVLFVSYLPAMALETPIGLSRTQNGMEIAAVYLQAIEMEPKDGPHAMRAREKSDIHLEADIRAEENNPNGFAAGEWVPNLTVHYTLIKLDTNEKVEGHMMPMVANDGPHYGDNVKMPGVGKYKLIYRIDNPLKQGFGRHVDKETGVGPWFKAFEVEWEFKYFGAGKKGGY
ncbi:MAG: iron transporter [Nitrospirae bacterium]|nr:iron transporter [Nitrospirota bacterium]